MNCTHCQATTTNGLALCQTCKTTLSVALVNVAAYHSDVLRIRPGERVKVRSSYRSTPPPAVRAAHDPISAATSDVDNMLATWCRVLVDDRPGIGTPPADATRQCGWLEGHLGSVATLEWGGELLRDCLAAERRLMRLLDRADTGWYAGRCGAELQAEFVHDGTHDGSVCLCACHDTGACDIEGGCGSEVVVVAAVTCERPLYATPGHGWIRCPECGTTYDSGQRREVMMREARDHVAPVAVIARAVVGLLDDELSVERLANRMDAWVSRGKLKHLGTRVLAGGKPQRVYRLGDVFDLLDPQLKARESEAC